ncbi:MAG: nucleotidyltransferase family protein [Candidatus Omnitrophica bacterium]|nr:nucleotidyltransferase family protein [Candidatus Omnitrophota bacterium]MCM8827337.1 nucleotidyltransferase family protein [Candidatus Omnitrophota bacterium]
MDKKIKEITKILKSLKDSLKSEYKAEILGIFGSYVRGEEKENSDLDVLVRFLEGATLLNLVGLANFLEERLAMKVDIVPIDTIREEIKEDILEEAIYL